jgi:cell division protease FtsH
VQQLARQALDQALSMLRPRRALMDELVDLLIERETIDGDLFVAVVQRTVCGDEAPALALSRTIS